MEKAKDYLSFLVDEVHSTVFATVDKNGEPETSIIDLMLYDEDSVYFLTAKGKPFYDRLMDKKVVSISAMKGMNTMSTKAIMMKAKVMNIGRDKLDEIFEKNTYMNEIYTSEESKMALEVFKVYDMEGEYLDMSQQPILRKTFSIGGGNVRKASYHINGDCIGCGKCFEVCSFKAIKKGNPYKIIDNYCFECGNCYSVCPVNAVDKNN
ncbi:4Fe-4S binding protein [Anaerofustis butyriciformans]|uniref:4Fe-4S binding protein n=1 Tax=Anaerofustis TaxID=264995 RepID=UPI003F894CF0